MTEEPEFVDVSALPLVADEEWYVGQMLGASQNGSGRSQTWPTVTLADVTDEPPLPPSLGADALGAGLLYPGKRHVWSGPQESAKTLAAYVAGLSVIRAGDPVVLVDFEMGPWDAKRRFRELGASEEELGRVTYVEPQIPASSASVERLIALEPGLVIVDAAAGAFQLEGLDDNARKDVEVWSAAWIAPFWRAKVATLVLDHVTKNAETRGNYAIGSERKVGGVDVHLGFTVIEAIQRGESGRYKITTHKDRGGFLRRGKLAEFVLVSDPETHALTWTFEPWVEGDDEEPWEPTVLMERVSNHMQLQLGAVSQRSIESDVTGKARDLRKAIVALVRRGCLERREGKNGFEIEFVTAYHEGASQVRPVRPETPQMRGASRVPPSREDAEDAPQLARTHLEDEDAQNEIEF